MIGVIDPRKSKTMATAPHTETSTETPSQGIFIGNLALWLIALTILVPAVALFAAATHNFS
jgi:hypothetical protein